ncbi:MAG: hypothetical protein WAT81_02685 [Candidatus Moraniibacteriota bacterium]
MAGINLSQSIQEKQAIARGSFFDKGFFINMTLFLIVVGLYGGSHWYLGTLEEEYTSLQGELSAKTAGLKNKESDRATDLSTRLKAISNNLEFVSDPKLAFEELEQLTIPNITVTSYLYQESESDLIIKGTTMSLRYLAQQMLNYKKIVNATTVHVENVTYNEKFGFINFELHISVAEPTPLIAPASGTVPITP